MARVQFVLAAAAAGVLLAAQPLEAEVLVSAASSLTDVMSAVATRYEAVTGEHVLLNLAASNTLARQIAAGARVDVFVSADEAQMDRVAGDIQPGTRFDLLSNRLAVAVPRGASGIRTPRDLLGASVRRIAIGDPAAVPAGVYARAYFEQLGLWASLEGKIIPAGSVRLALAAVERGAADAAVVYATDVMSARGAATAFVVPVGEGPRIRYPVAAMTSATNPDGARRFIAFLRGPEAQAVFTAAGFGVLSDRQAKR